VKQELTERAPIAVANVAGNASAVLEPRTRIGFVSLGCPKNLVDTEVMMGLLDQAGAEITTRPETADILVVNTCSFIDKAKQESIDTILQMAEHKLSGKARKLIVAGCLVERYRDEIRKNMPEVDAVVGTGELEAILAAAGLETPMPAPDQPQLFSILPSGPLSGQNVASRAEGDLRESQGRFARETWSGAQAKLPQYLYDHTTPRLLATQKSSAYIKIAEGCDHPCSFCVIPNLRGKFRSRRFASVIAEAEQLVSKGVRELTLIGQDTTCYGEDLGMKDGLAQLLDSLAQIPNLKWLRFLYAYPNKITGRLLDTIAQHEVICKYLDMPLQHASGPVLKSMRRGGNADIFLKTLERVRAAVPGIAIRSTFIAGFPGENEADFDVLSDFVRAAKLDWLGVFSYSDEEGSGAFHLGDKVPARTIESRRRSLMRLQQSISRKSRASLVGRRFELLVEGASEETPLLWEGRTEHQAPEIDGKVFINDFGPFEQLNPGHFYQCEITESQDYDLVGRIIAE
jgi:ribosomal protein S12 methylthiotransferase